MSYHDIVASQVPCRSCGRPVVKARGGLGFTHLYAKDRKKCNHPEA